MTYALAAFLRPLLLALIVLLIGYPIRRFVVGRMKDGRLKRLLLKRIY
jgi:hypothetical protein